MRLHPAGAALAFGLFLTSPFFAQGTNPSSALAPQSSSTIPTAPDKILQMAVEVNGLHGLNLQPWHIKASYQTFDLKGKPKESGTYEEFWISDKKYRRSYTSTSFTQTDVATAGHLYRSGDQDWPRALEANIRTDLTQPIPDMSSGNFRLAQRKQSFGSVELRCVTLTSDEVYADLPLYCFAEDQPVLRIDASPGGTIQTTFNDFTVFQGRVVAKDIELLYLGKPELSLHVRTIEPISQIDEADFTPPNDAKEMPTGKVTLSLRSAAGFRLWGVAPEYPRAAREAHVQGTVIVQVTIGKDGSVVAATATSGPSELRQSAVDVVRQWRYQPFLLLGEPVEVEAPLQITYTLGQ